MMLWILLAVMAAIAAAGLIAPPLARRSRADGGSALADQLRAIDAEVAAGTLTSSAADALRIEARRRAVAEAVVAEPPPRPPGRSSRSRLTIGLAAAVAASAMLLYSVIGRPDLVAAPRASRAPPASDFGRMIAALEAKMRRSPGDPTGWRLLGWSYMRAGRYAEAAAAYDRAARLDTTDSDSVSAGGEALTQAAGGRVTPAAATAFARAMRRDPLDPRARYYLALARDQRGDHAGALADWISLLRSAPPDASWTADVRAMITRIARADGESLPADFPPPPTNAPLRGQ